VLLSTHILPEINSLCNRVLIINQGRVVLDERPENLGRTMGETFEVSLEVKGPREQILEQLQEIEAIAMIKDLQPSPSGASEPAEAVKLLVTSAGGTDIREALFFRMAGAGYPILEMKRESLSLEDIFLKLTTDEPAAHADSIPHDSNLSNSSERAIGDSPKVASATTDKTEVDPDA
jgi:ABC-2 type transport system ATP-binding protein